MNNDNQWQIPKKEAGTKLKVATMKFSPTYLEAVSILAKQESDRTGRKISQSTVISNLSIRNGEFARDKRVELRAIQRQLNKENKHGKDGTR